LKAYDVIRIYLNAFFHLLYPQICFGCGTDQLDPSSPLCDTCVKDLPYTEFFSIQDNVVEKIFWGRIPVQSAGALLFFTKDSLVQNLMAQLKYHHNKKVGFLLGRLMGQAIAAQSKFNPIDLLIPIPIRRSKINSRGYNQSLVIATGIQSIWDKPIDHTILKKSNWTSTQTKKDRSARLHAQLDLFELKDPRRIKGKNILLIDDVLTTGATLEAAVQCLMAGEPASISIAVAAYTL
jgi:ComF family protein